MIGTEQERAALKRILAVLKPILTDHKPPIAIDWVGKGSIAVGREFESAINAVREHKDDDVIRAMLAPDDAVVIPRVLAEAAAENLEMSANEFRLVDMIDAANERQADAEALRAVLRGEATR